MKAIVETLGGIVALMVLGACILAYKIPTPPMTEPPSFRLVDKRTDTEKQGNSSKLISSCDYGITQMAEDAIEPRRLEILRSRLQSEKGLQEKLKGKSIEIDSFKIIRNAQMSFRRGVGDKYPGALSQSLVYGCIAGPEIEGSYLTKENPKDLPSFTVLLSARIGGQKYNIRHFETANSVNETLAKREDNILPRVLNNALGKFVQEIEARN